MTTIKKLLALLLALTMLFSLASLLAGCEDSGKKKSSSSKNDDDEEEEEEEEETENKDDETSEEGDEKDPEASDPEESKPAAAEEYTVSVKTAGGAAMENVEIYIYEDEALTQLVAIGATDENGQASTELPGNATYYITCSAPLGYAVEQYYTFDGTSAEIILTPSLIQGDISSADLGLGDVMYDFTVTTPDGEDITLSQVLEDKKAVILNFWYTSCSWCATEFPCMEEAYQQYQDDVEIIALNPLGEGNDTIAAYPDMYGLSLSFPMAECPMTWANALGIYGYPTSVVIDRYGVIVLVEVGAVVETDPFLNLFETLTADNYEQKLYNSILEADPDYVPSDDPEENVPEEQEAVLTVHQAAEGKNVEGNCFYYDGEVISLRTYGEFIPSRSGVYRITSRTDSGSSTTGRICDSNENELLYYQWDERLYTDSNNVSMVFYMEAGESYYINIFFYDIGNIYYDIEFLGSSYALFRSCSPGPFTYSDSGPEIIAEGINVVLGEDGIYYHDLGGGKKGSPIYADFTGNTMFGSPLLSDGNVKGVIEMGGFDFSKTENDQYILSILKQNDNDVDKTIAYLKTCWGDSYEEYYELYQVEDVLNGIYHGSGEDMTNDTLKYTSHLITTGAEELHGCVAVTEELAEMLQMLMDKYSFEGVDTSWRKLCYYYDYMG